MWTVAEKQVIKAVGFEAIVGHLLKNVTTSSSSNQSFGSSLQLVESHAVDGPKTDKTNTIGPSQLIATKKTLLHLRNRLYCLICLNSNHVFTQHRASRLDVRDKLINIHERNHGYRLASPSRGPEHHQFNRPSTDTWIPMLGKPLQLSSRKTGQPYSRSSSEPVFCIVVYSRFRIRGTKCIGW